MVNPQLKEDLMMIRILYKYGFTKRSSSANVSIAQVQGIYQNFDIIML